MDKPQLIQLPKFLDARGNLSFVEQENHIPFVIKRTYWLYDVPGGESRGGHAYKNNQEFIVALSGSFDVILDDGYEKNKTPRIVIALDKAIEANDQISVSAYTNKGDDSKISTPYFLFSNGTELTDDNKTYIDLGYDSNTEPSTQTYTVPEAAAGSTSFKITRSMTGTNLFITKLVVTRGGTTGITEKTVINSVMNNIIFNLAGQKVGADYKGIVIKNGRKFIQK